MGEEQSMVEFIVKKINERIHPSELLKQLHQILDEDAEQFMIKMWRMLIYEMLSASLKSN
jgi:RNA-binding protein 25